jgi:putative transposase
VASEPAPDRDGTRLLRHLEGLAEPTHGPESPQRVDLHLARLRCRIPSLHTASIAGSPLSTEDLASYAHGLGRNSWRESTLALGASHPGDVYTPSARVYAPPPEPEYPYHDRSVRVTHCGRICVGRRKINLSTVFAGEIVGIREVEDQIWLVRFLDFDLGFFDQNEGRVEPAPNPFGPKVSTGAPE